MENYMNELTDTEVLQGPLGPGQMDDSGLLTVEEAAGRLKIDAITVRRLMRQGRIKWVEFSPRVRRLRSRDLAEYVEKSIKGGWKYDESGKGTPHWH